MVNDKEAEKRRAYFDELKAAYLQDDVEGFKRIVARLETIDRQDIVSHFIFYQLFFAPFLGHSKRRVIEVHYGKKDELPL